MTTASGYLEFGSKWKLDEDTAKEITFWSLLEDKGEETPKGKCNWKVGHLLSQKKPIVRDGYGKSNPILYLSGNLNDMNTEIEWLRLIIKKFLRPNGYELWGKITFNSDTDLHLNGNDISIQESFF